MLTKKYNEQTEMVMCTMEQIVPQNSIFRKIDKYIDFSFIYEDMKTIALKCKKKGKVPIKRGTKSSIFNKILKFIIFYHFLIENNKPSKYFLLGLSTF